MIQRMRAVVLYVIIFIFLCPTLSSSYELTSRTHYDEPLLYERNVQKVIYSKTRNKLFALHSHAVTVIDLTSASPVKYYTVYPSGLPDSYVFFPPNHQLYDIVYDEDTQKLIVSAAWGGVSMKLVVIDEPANSVLTILDLSSSRIVPFTHPGAVYRMKLFQGKVFFLAEARNTTLGPSFLHWDFRIFASYGISSGVYEEYVSRGAFNYYDYESRTFRDGGPSDGMYADFSFYDDGFVMVSDVVTHFVYPYPVIGWGSILKGSVLSSDSSFFSGSKTVEPCPYCYLGQCVKSGGGLGYFYSYSVGDMNSLMNYSVTLPKNLPNVRVVYTHDIGYPPLAWSCNGYGDMFYAEMLADNRSEGLAGFPFQTIDRTLRPTKIEMKATDIFQRGTPLMGSTATTLSSSLKVTTIPPHIHTKLTYDSEPSFDGGLRTVATLGNDIYLIGVQLEAGETFIGHGNRNDVLVLSQNALTNLSKAFSLPRDAKDMVAYGSDVAVLAGSRLYIINKDTGVKFTTPFTFYEPVSIAADAQEGVVVVGYHFGVDVLRFKADRLITEFEVKPQNKIMYPYADGPTGSEAEVKINFTLAKDAKMTIQVEDSSKNVLTALLQDELYPAGEYTFEVKAGKKGDGILWTGNVDDPLLEQQGSTGRSIVVAPDGHYIFRLIAVNASGTDPPRDEASAEIEVKSQ